jgi:hypothetical protein
MSGEIGAQALTGAHEQRLDGPFTGLERGRQSALVEPLDVGENQGESLTRRQLGEGVLEERAELPPGEKAFGAGGLRGGPPFERGVVEPPRRRAASAEQRQRDLRLLVGLRQDGDARLLNDLVSGELRRFRGEVGVQDSASGGGEVLRRWPRGC